MLLTGTLIAVWVLGQAIETGSAVSVEAVIAGAVGLGVAIQAVGLGYLTRTMRSVERMSPHFDPKSEVSQRLHNGEEVGTLPQRVDNLTDQVAEMRSDLSDIKERLDDADR